MADQFVGQLMLVGFNFAPVGWALANGQIMAISQNTALFSLLGTQFGGNGQSTFALPNMQDCVAVGQGQGPGLTPRVMGETGGTQSVTLVTSQTPQHTHFLQGTASSASLGAPGGNVLGNSGAVNIYASGTGNTKMSTQMIATVGSGQPHNNAMQYQVLVWVIALQGIFPARS